MFELTNEQRKYFGITLVHSNWDFIKLTPSPYDKHDTYAYFDGNTIRKRIAIGDNFYTEYDLNEETANGRTQLLSKTGRGKVVFYEMANRDRVLYSEFRNNGIGWGVNVKLPILKKCIELDSNEPYWEQNNYLTNTDLRNPKFYKERGAICKQFGVSEDEIFLNK